MKTDLDHLPPQKQREIERVVQLIFAEFDDAFALAKHEWKKAEGAGMVGLVRSTRYVLALASPAPPAPLPRSGFVLRPKNCRKVRAASNG